MPDYFVPLDTSLNSHYLNELYTSRAIFEYTFNYGEKHGEDLEKQGFENFLEKFRVTDAMLADVVRVGERNRVKADNRELSKKKKLFQIHVKAQIARKLWGSEGYYPVMHQTDEVFQHSLKVFDRIPELTRNEM